jgi:phospholipid-binding lipoprotein MlaA
MRVISPLVFVSASCFAPNYAENPPMLMLYLISVHFHRQTVTMALYRFLNLPLVKVYYPMIKISAIVLLATVTLGACTTAPQGVSVHDPFEVQNRQTHAFNKSVSDKFSGAGGGAGDAIPTEVTDRVVDFADNVSLPGMVVNGLLQGDLNGAVTNATRFLINTTVGVLGLFDPADAVGVTEQETDFGETLAVWGVTEGAYLELPFLGPTTERALFGRVVDIFLDPLESVGTKAQIEYATVGKLAGRVIKVTQASDTIDSVLNDSADSYAQLRLIYLQNRRFELGTTMPEDAVDPYDDIFGDQ